MPLIKIEFDNEKVSEKEILDLSTAVQKIVSAITVIEDVFVYANSAQVKVKIAPIEIFIEMSAHKIKDRVELIGKIKENLARWKQESNFQYLINLTLIPMDWNIEIGI